MANLVNPGLSVIVYGTADFIIEPDAEGNQIYVDYDITKDLDEEPNECELTIYNLGESLRDSLTAAEEQYMPIEVYLTQAESTTLKLAFRGEIEYAKHANMRPGHETFLHCTSQQMNFRTKYVDTRSFKAGTYHSAIIEFLADQVGLPKQIDTLPESVTTLGESFSGPAFPILEKYVRDLGLTAYILDGTLHISNIYSPQNPTVIEIDYRHLLMPPSPTAQNDLMFAERRIYTEVINLDNQNKRKNRRTISRKEYGANDYATIEAYEDTVYGMDFEMLCYPTIQPDSLISVNHPKTEGRTWRVTEVNHRGNNETYMDWTTTIKTVSYEKPSLLDLF